MSEVVTPTANVKYEAEDALTAGAPTRYRGWY